MGQNSDMPVIIQTCDFCDMKIAAPGVGHEPGCKSLMAGVEYLHCKERLTEDDDPSLLTRGGYMMTRRIDTAREPYRSMPQGNRISAALAVVAEQSHFGMPVKVDPSMPRDQIRFEQNGVEVGRIVVGHPTLWQRVKEWLRWIAGTASWSKSAKSR